jgi:signal transduction histidine kinase
MADMGFITNSQLEKALTRQKEIFQERTPQEESKEAFPIPQVRIAQSNEKTPLLGIILNYMGFATIEEIEKALDKQGKMTEVYKLLDSEKLGLTLELSAIVNSTIHLPEVISLIMKYVNNVVKSASSVLMLRDQKTGELVFSVPMEQAKDGLRDIRIPSGKGIAGWVAERERPLLVPDAKEDPRFDTDIDERNGFETKSILCLPLKATSKLIGVLEIINKLDNTPFTEEDTFLLSIFAYHATVAIENARLYSELKDNLEEEAQVQKQLAEYDKTEALGQMASSVAHEFNNLLMHIQGNISLMLLDLDSNHPHHERLKNIEQSVMRGSDVSKQLLGFARGGKYDVKTVDLNDIVEKSSQVFGRTKNEIKIYRKYQTDVWTVEGDQGQIEHVLLNLYRNAWQAMPGGGELFLEVENVHLDREFAKPYNSEPGDYVKISIRDTGVGMDKESQERVFDPFFTTKETVRGTGLGLPSAYGIINNHKGIITVQSELGEGTTFSIYLPTPKKEVKKEREVPRRTPPGKETVLLVDDEDMIIEIGKEMLEKMDYKVFTTKNGEEAVKIFKEHKDIIDLVILDMIMPDMGGGETYDRMKEINPDVKVLLSSGYSENGEATSILERGCSGFIQKPFSMKDLLSKIRVILD